MILTVFGLLAAMTSVGRAQTPDELREQRKLNQQELALIASDIDAYSTEADELIEAINELEAGLDAKEAELAAAKRAVEQAEAARKRAEDAIAALKEQQRTTRESLREAAVEAYLEFQGVSDLQEFIADPWGSTRLETLAEFGTGSGSDELDRLRTIDAELVEQRQIADEAAVEAGEKQAEVAAQVKELESLRDSRRDLLVDAEDRLESRLTEAASLEELDAEFAKQIQQEEARIAEALEAERIAKVLEAERIEAARIAREKEAERKQAESRGSKEAESTSSEETGKRSNAGDADNYQRVRGILVAHEIAENLEALLAEMEAEGYKLNGSGWRSNARQIELRKSHCGTSEYSVWEKPARQCRPPTARPGRSNHEVGLAVDFTHNGRIIRSRNSDVFKALMRIAPKHGFRNLPSEPWHWDADFAP